MNVGEFLKNQQQTLLTCEPDEMVGTVIARLADNNIGALPVCGAEGKLVGIISERDLIRAFARDSIRVMFRKVRELMTTNVITCDLNAPMSDAEKRMNERRIRHLPVVDNHRVVAIVSIRDVVAWRVQLQKDEIFVLRDAVVAARHS
jgi:CBS domain-containing protein